MAKKQKMIENKTKIIEAKSAFRTQSQQLKSQEINPDDQKKWTPKLCLNIYSKTFKRKIKLARRFLGFEKLAFFGNWKLFKKGEPLFPGLEITGNSTKRKERNTKIKRCIKVINYLTQHKLKSNIPCKTILQPWMQDEPLVG